MEDVIRVHICHFKGGRTRGPAFELRRGRRACSRASNGRRMPSRLTSGATTVRVNTADAVGRWTFFHGDRRLTGQRRREAPGTSSTRRDAVHARAALPGRRRVRVRPGRAVHALREERPGRRHVERGRRDQQRAGIQEHSLLPDAAPVTACWWRTPRGCPSRSPPR